MLCSTYIIRYKVWRLISIYDYINYSRGHGIYYGAHFKLNCYLQNKIQIYIRRIYLYIYDGGGDDGGDRGIELLMGDVGCPRQSGKYHEFHI